PVRTLFRLAPPVERGWRKFIQVVFEKTLAEAVLEPGLRRRAVGWWCRRNLTKIADPDLRAKVTPDYEPLCRRMVFSPDYYRAIQRSDVDIVTDPIVAVEAD